VTTPEGPEVAVLDEHPGENEEPAGTRRLLYGIVGGLAVAVIVLGLLLAALLRAPPASAPASPAEPANVDIVSVLGMGDAEGRLDRPMGVASDPRGNVWVSDTGNSRVVVFDASGVVVRVVGADEGPGRLESPYGVTVDAERDRVYVADWTAGAVRVYSSESGRYLESLPAPEQDPAVFGGQGFSPYHVRAVGSRVVVSSNDGLYFFDRTGMVAERWGGQARGQAPGEFNFPNAFDVEPSTGRVYVADTLNRRIVALERDGGVAWISGSPDQEEQITGFWQLPRGLVVASDGNVFVVDTFRFDSQGEGIGHIVVLNPDGELVSEFWRSGSTGDGLNFPEKIGVGPDGTFAIADRDNHRVILFRVNGLPAPHQREAEMYRGSFTRQ
jgi:DNA-binding beta-propeller fold protein YncE